MSDGWKRHKPARVRLSARLPGGGAIVAPADWASARERELLAAAWEALNVARDNKALVIAKAGTLLNANHLALQLCGHSLADIAGKSIFPELLENAPSPRAELSIDRWETTLQRASGSPIAVEVVREPLGTRLHDVDVYAIRDLRERHNAAEERHRQTKALRRREEEFDKQNLRFEMALRSLSQGICVFDADLRLVICNEPYLRIYGFSPDQVKPGTTLREILELGIAKGLHTGASPQAFVSERLAAIAENKVAIAIHDLPDGRIIDLTHNPILGGGWVATHEDVTERRRMEAALARSNCELEAQNRRFDTAMNNISQGLCFFDGNQRLIVCNQRYVQMYRLPEEYVRPGITLREIVEYRFKAGSCPEMTAEQYLAWRDNIAVSSKSSDSTVKLMDGRTFAIHHEPMPDGGWVATHQDITEQCRTEARIAHMASHDALTGLPNRVLFNERLEQALTRTNRGEIVATHLFDLDNFKTVNDTLGHPAGDKLLQIAADRVRALVRGTDTIARMGGDEFAIVQVALSDPTDATLLAHRIITRISEPYEIEGHQVMIGASVGIAIGRQGDSSTPEQLIRNADLALYRAKGDGRGTFCFFEPEMDAQMRGRRELEQDLRKALAAGEFELYYQPLVDITSNEITGFEALMRWNHPEKGLVEPSAFIPLAEEIGLIIPMGEWAIRDACATVARWPAHLKVAVNLSTVQFRSPGLLRVIAGALGTSGLSPDRLELEITETTLHDSSAALALLYELRDLGVRIAMDDFGTGYSSLSYLQSFPFDRIKIDRSFVKDIAESTGSLNIVRAVTALAKGLGMGATAEGVETAEQRATVQSEGCTEMQGFLFSQPIPAREIERLFLARQNQTAA